jgi:4-hydroxy-4-methyl-2-oxoglutarate aldolase
MTQPVIYTRIPKSDTDLIAQARECGVSDLHEALGAVGGRMALMSPRMRPLNAGLRIAGPAVTAYNYPGDNLMIHKALHVLEPGQVLIFTNGGGTQGALWGEMAATYAQRKGVAGVIVDGSTRDTDALSAMRFPVWSTAISPSHPDKRAPGSVNVPIVCDGVLVIPGDIVVADGDGVLVIPRADLRLAVEGARARMDKEVALKKRLETGVSLFELLNMQAALDATGIEVRDTTWQEDEARRR